MTRLLLSAQFGPMFHTAVDGRQRAGKATESGQQSGELGLTASSHEGGLGLTRARCPDASRGQQSKSGAALAYVHVGLLL